MSAYTHRDIVSKNQAQTDKLEKPKTVVHKLRKKKQVEHVASTAFLVEE